MQQLSGALPAQPQAKNILPPGLAECKETSVASQKKSIHPVDVTDNNKSLSEVGKSEDQPLVPASQNPTSTSSIPQPTLAKSSQLLKAEPLKEDTVSAVSQASAKAASVLPESVEIVTSGKTKLPTVKEQKDIKAADEAPNVQSLKNVLEKGDSKLQKSCSVCKENFKEDPSNYNTCESCKAIVCNLCGEMNSTEADTTEVRKYLTKCYLR